ncbi:hypothetical protein R3I94_001819 [Phoxinus phoxinus]
MLPRFHWPPPRISKQAPPPRKKVDYGSSSLKAEVKAKARQQETLEAAGGEFSLSLTARDLTERGKRRTRISRFIHPIGAISIFLTFFTDFLSLFLSLSLSLDPVLPGAPLILV